MNIVLRYRNRFLCIEQTLKTPRGSMLDKQRNIICSQNSGRTCEYWSLSIVVVFFVRREVPYSLLSKITKNNV